MVPPILVISGQGLVFNLAGHKFNLFNPSALTGIKRLICFNLIQAWRTAEAVGCASLSYLCLFLEQVIEPY